MKNKERFFGLHFDFHADNTQRIGYRTVPEDIERYILTARPDFIQCDCKGHPGNSSYPTKVGNAAAMLESDNLRIFCDIAKKHGIPLFVHYSGVYDAAYTKANPNMAQINEKGEPTDKISLFGNYVTDLMIPQLKELVENYGISGAWIDGDCWAVFRDYSSLAKPYLKDGITKEEHNAVMREAFLRYVKTYVDEMHSFAPDFKITSNWMFATHMPQKPTVDIDFISGDYSPSDSLHKARYDARIIAAQGKPWDLMSWSFEWTHFVDKPAIQMMQESAGVLSLGGGFQLYITQNSDGSVRRINQKRFADVADFVHARRFLFGKQSVADVAVFLSTKSYYKKANIFNAEGANKCIVGALNAILDAGIAANILLEYQTDKLNKYRTVIIPEWEDIDEDAIRALIDYANCGGNLIVLGANTCKVFANRFGAEIGEIMYCKKAFILDDSGEFCAVTNLFSGEGTDVLDLLHGEEYLYSGDDIRDASIPAYRTDITGEGSVTYVPFGFGLLYDSFRSRTESNFIKKIILSRITPTVEIDRNCVDVTMQEDGDKLLVNLVNMCQGRHSLEYLVYDEIPDINGITVRINGDFLNVSMPLGEKFEVLYEVGKTIVKIETLKIHSVITLERRYSTI